MVLKQHRVSTLGLQYEGYQVKLKVGSNHEKTTIVVKRFWILDSIIIVLETAPISFASHNFVLRRHETFHFAWLLAESVSFECVLHAPNLDRQGLIRLVLVSCPRRSVTDLAKRQSSKAAKLTEKCLK